MTLCNTSKRWNGCFGSFLFPRAVFNLLFRIKTLSRINWSDSQHLGQYKAVFTQQLVTANCAQTAASQIMKGQALLPREETNLIRLLIIRVKQGPPTHLKPSLGIRTNISTALELCEDPRAAKAFQMSSLHSWAAHHGFFGAVPTTKSHLPHFFACNSHHNSRHL